MRYVCAICHGNQYQIWIDGEDEHAEEISCLCKQLGLPPFIDVAEPKSAAKNVMVEFRNDVTT